MRKIIGLLFIPFICLAQFQFIPINADYSSFYSTDSLAYVQVYMSIYQGNLKYHKNDDGVYTASFLNKIEITQDGKLISQNFHRYQNSTQDTSTFNRFNQFVDVFNFELPYGEYKADIQITDNKSSLKGQYILDIKTITPSDQVFFSDLELCTELKRDTTKNIFYKNGLRVVPNPRSTYNILQPMLYYYVELNNLPYSAEENNLYSFEYNITNSDGDTIKTRKPVTKKIIAPTLVEAGGLNVISFPSGIYFLNVKAVDSKSGSSMHASKKFLVYKQAKKKPAKSIAKDLPDIDEMFITLTQEQCLHETKLIRYIAAPQENRIMKNLENVNALRQFLTNFWRARDRGSEVAPGRSRREYFSRVEHANEVFTSMGRKGWQTDRGRVFLIYGEPDEYERHASSMDMLPHVIWYYHNLEGGAQFVFADRGGFGEYQLIHSSYRKELQNPNWQSVIRKNSGDPFQGF